MKKLLSCLTLGIGLWALALPAQTTTNNPGVPIFNTPPAPIVAQNYYGTINPNSNVVAGAGSRYIQYTNGLYTEWFKTNNTGNTGWNILLITTNGNNIVINTNATSISGGALNTVSNIVQGEAGWVNVLDYGAVGDGVTDDTAAFKSAIATQRKVYVPDYKTNGYVVSNLVFTNGSGLISFGQANLIFKTGATGWMILCGNPVYLTNGSYYTTNPLPSNITFSGIRFNGGIATNETSLGTLRHGVWLEPYGTGNIFVNCEVDGFDGYGTLVQSYAMQATTNTSPFQNDDQASLVFHDWHGRTNGCSLKIASGPITAPWTDTDKYLSEYIVANDLSGSYGYMGLWLQSGNNRLSTLNFSRNAIDLFANDLSPSINGQHCTVQGTFNHASIAGIMCTNVINGLVLDGCQLWFSPIYLTNCVGVAIQNGEANSSSSFTVSGGGANVFRNNIMADNFNGCLYLGGTTNSGNYNNKRATDGAVDNYDPKQVWPAMTAPLSSVIAYGAAFPARITAGVATQPPYYMNDGYSWTPSAQAQFTLPVGLTTTSLLSTVWLQLTNQANAFNSCVIQPSEYWPTGRVTDTPIITNLICSNGLNSFKFVCNFTTNNQVQRDITFSIAAGTNTQSTNTAFFTGWQTQWQ